MSGPEASPGGRDRPPGLAPRGTAWGLGAIVALTLVSPTGAVFSAATWAPLSLDELIGSVFGSVFFSFVVFMPLAAGLRTGRFWVVCWYFAAGVLSLFGYTLAVLIAVCGLLHIYPTLHPDLIGVAWLGRLFLVACAPMLLALWQGLRLNFWRPWTSPETWEVGDERNARWAMQLAGKTVGPATTKGRSSNSGDWPARPQ